tara:strand:+ start:164 stop:1510 length:1347 start_codon:yes stop_codon:yes gene_type:complete
MVINYNKKVKELIDSGKKKEAIALTEEQIQLEPLNIRNYLILGQLFNNLNDYSGAEINFKKAYEIDSNNKDTFKNLTHFYSAFAANLKDKGEFLKAIKYHKKLVKIDTLNKAAHLSNIGANYRFLKDFDKAVEFYNKSLKIDKSYLTPYLNLSDIYRSKEDYQKFFETIKTLLKTFKESSKAFPSSVEKKIIKKGYTSYLETLYKLNKKSEYKSILKEVSDYNSSIITVAAIDTFASNQFGIKARYPFCNDPISFLYFDNIYKESKLDKNLFTKLIQKDLSKHEFIYDKTGKATRGGEQTKSNLFKSADGNMLTLKNIIIEKIRNYRKKINKEDCHFSKKWPKKFTLEAWCVKYDGGKQISHNHPDGWLSGVFYLNVPENLKNNEGAIKFSIHGANYPIIKDFCDEKIHNPSTGDIVLFPSSLFHETFPYSSNDKREVIAFDLSPYEA